MLERVKIDLPDSFPFRTEIPLLIGHINYGGHLANDAVLAIAHEARLRFLLARGMSELSIGGGLGLIQADAVVVYRGEARHGDRLIVEVAAAGFAGSRFVFLYRMTDAATGREIARCRTGMSAFDYAAGKPRPLPAGFAERLGAERERN